MHYVKLRTEGDANKEANLLLTVEARNDWEVMFGKKFLIPTIQVCHHVVNQVFVISLYMQCF